MLMENFGHVGKNKPREQTTGSQGLKHFQSEGLTGVLPAVVVLLQKHNLFWIAPLHQTHAFVPRTEPLLHLAEFFAPSESNLKQPGYNFKISFQFH